MTAAHGVRARTGAVVRKPPGKEPAGGGSRCCRAHYGDFEGAIEDVGVDEVCDGPTVKPRSFRNEARVAWELVPDADPSFAGLTRYGLG